MKKINLKDNAERILEILGKKIRESNVINGNCKFALAHSFSAMPLMEHNTDSTFLDVKGKIPIVMVIEENSGLILSFAIGTALSELLEESEE